MTHPIVLAGLQQTTLPRTREGDQPPAIARCDGTPNSLGEDIRRLVGAGWVEEIVVQVDEQPEMVSAAVEAVRLVGRRLRLVSAEPLTDLPGALPGERWIREDATWVLLPLQRPWPLRAAKRLIDIVVAAVLLLLVAPIMLAVALAIRITSGCPTMYRCNWLGENGRPFVGFKFRTMVRNADNLKPALLLENERHGPVFKMARDPRVTPIGRVLRKYSLDELPQLWSVLIGDLSLVGPRAPMSSEYPDFELWQMRKLAVKPGLTCIWQVEGRSTVTKFSEWVRLDLEYIDTWSLWLDIRLMFRTPLVILQGTGS